MSDLMHYMEAAARHKARADAAEAENNKLLAKLDALADEPYTDAGPTEYRLGWNQCLKSIRSRILDQDT